MYELIKQLCNSKGISPTKLCTEITGSKGNLPTWQKGNINPTSLIKIADYFDVSTDYLLGRTDNPNGCSGDNITIGDTNGNYNMTVGKGEAKPLQIDGLSKEMLEKFESLDFDKKVEVMALISSLSKK